MTVTRIFVVLAAAAVLLPAAPAMAFCSKPIAPHCVADGTLADSYVPEERCRRAVQSHLEDLTRYRNCLAVELEQVDEVVERFRNLLSKDAEKSRIPPAAPTVPGTPVTAEATG